MIPQLKKSHTEANPPLTYDQKKQTKIKVLNKLGFKNTEEQQHAAVVDILGNSRYFQRFITNPKQRRELIEALAPYVEFEFYPRGTGVCYHGEIINKFSVAVKGRALVYSPKLKEELVETDDTSFRQEVLRTYINYYREELSLKKKPQVLPPSTVPVLKSSATCVEKTFKITSIEPIQEPLNKKKDAPTLLETVLATKPTIKGYLLQYDLSPEERLFLVANLENAEEYINLGDFDMKPTAYLDPGDTYNEVCLLRSGYSASTIVAVEDFCVISFTMQDFPVIYATVAGSNLREKKNFLDTLFPALSKDSRLKILYYLEERVVNKGEILYKEGDEANEFYMVKDGEIELLTHKHQYNNANSKHLDRKLALKISPNDRITIGTFHEGTILGEEDVINSTTRTTFAVARQLDTFIYVLKKKIYKEVFVAYFDHIASAFKDWVVVKDKWQKERVSAEQQFTYRRVNAQDKEGDNKRNDKSKYKKYGSSVSQDASPKKEEPIVLNTEEKEKLFRLKMNSSLSLKCVVRGKPPQIEESLASARYQERRTKNADPFISHRQYSSVQRESSDFRQSRVKNQTPVDPSDIIETTRLFTPNANLIRQQKRIQSQIESNAKRETPSFRKTPFPSLDYMLGGDYSDMRSPSPLLKSVSNLNNMDQSRHLVRQESPFDYDGNTPVKIKSYPINKQPFLLNQPSMPLLQIIKGVSQTSLDKEIVKRKSDKIPTLIKLKRPGKHSRAISVPKSQTFFNIHPV